MIDEMFEVKPRFKEDLLHDHIDDVVEWVIRGLEGNERQIVKSKVLKMVNRMYSMIDGRVE